MSIYKQLGTLPINIAEYQPQFQGVPEKELMSEYYTKQLNAISPWKLGSMRNGMPEGKQKDDLRRYSALKNYTEYVQDRQFHNNREEQMPPREYFPGTMPQRMESPMPVLGTGHEALLERQRKRGLLKEHEAGSADSTKELLNTVYGKGSV